MDASSSFVFEDGAAYELMMGRWSALVAAPFLGWLNLPEGLDWLDNGCGDGSFAEQLVLRQKPLSVVGVDPAPAQLAFARQRAGAAGILYLNGDAESLPLWSASVDAAVLALVLFFLPSPALALRELVRVVRPGGTIAAYHWDIDGGGSPLQPVLHAVRAEGHKSQSPPSAWASKLQASKDLWRDAGLTDVQACQFEVHRRFESFEAYWQTVHGSHQLRDLFASLSATALYRLKERVREQIHAAGTAPIILRAVANAVKGQRGE